MHAGRLIPELAVRARIVGREKRADDKLAAFDLGNIPADLFDYAAIFVTLALDLSRDTATSRSRRCRTLKS
jgi:hypothetical protein